MALKNLDGKEDWGSKFVNLYNTLTATVNNLSAGTPAGTYTAGDGIDISGSSVISISGADQYVNLLSNADFSVAEAGVTVTSIASGAFFCDVWKYTKTGAMVHDASRSTNAPTITEAGERINYSGRLDCTTADTSIAATDNCIIRGFIEGFDFAKIAGDSFTVTFWHKHTIAGTNCVAFQNSGSDRSFIAEYTQAISGAWEQSTVTVTLPPDTGTWDYIDGVGLEVSFPLAMGSNWHNTANTWHTGNYFSTSNQVNNCSSTSNIFRIADIKFGSSIIKTGVQNQQQRLAQVQRYYEQGDYYAAAGTTNAAVVSSVLSPITFNTLKRIVPTVTGTNSQGTFSTGSITEGSVAIGRSNVVANRINNGTFIASARLT